MIDIIASITCICYDIDANTELGLGLVIFKTQEEQVVSKMKKSASRLTFHFSNVWNIV